MTTLTLKQKLHSTSPSKSILAAPFTSQLFSILMSNDYSDIISWSEDKKHFQIAKVQEFVKEVLPVHFETSDFKEFLKKLHGHGFTRNQETECFFTFSKPGFMNSKIIEKQNKKSLKLKEATQAKEENDNLIQSTKDMQRRIEDIENECRVLQKKKQHLSEVNEKLTTSEKALKSAICSLEGIFGIENIRAAAEEARAQLDQEGQSDDTLSTALSDDVNFNIPEIHSIDLDALDMTFKNFVRTHSFNEKALDAILDIDHLAPTRYASAMTNVSTANEFAPPTFEAIQKRAEQKTLQIEQESNDQWLENGLRLIGGL